MALEFKSVQEMNEKREKTFLIYGKAGTGKTTFVGTLPGKTVLLDIEERGTDSLQNKEGIMVTQIKNYQDLVDFMTNFQKYHDELKFDNVALDSIDHLQNMFMRDVIKKEKPNFEDWGKWNMACTTMLVFFKSICEESNIRVFYLSHEKDWSRIDSNDARNGVTARLSDGALAKVEASSDVIMNMVLRQVPVINPKTKKKVIDKKTGKVTVESVYLGILKAPSEVRTTKFRTTFRTITEKKGEFFIKNPKYAHFQKIYALEKKQNKK